MKQVIFYVEGRRKSRPIETFLKHYSIDEGRRFNPSRKELPATYWRSNRGNKEVSVASVI